MADEDTEKAEKLAAAKKRFEQLKKQQKGKKGGGAKKKDKAEAADPQASVGGADANDDDDKLEETVIDEPKAVSEMPEGEEERQQPEDVGDVTANVDDVARPATRAAVHGIEPSASVQDLYRKQVLRIEELEKDNKRLQTESHDAHARWKKMESELDELREASNDIAELRAKADQAETKSKEVDTLRTEVTSLQRQNAQLQAHIKPSRRLSSASPSHDDLASQLASKASTIQSLELEVSNLHAQLTQASAAATTQADRIALLQDQLVKADQAVADSAQEFSDLKASLEKASESAAMQGDSRSVAESRIVQLEAELVAARHTTAEASKRADTFEKKADALTTLHRESDARSQAKLREGDKELRSRVAALADENNHLKRQAASPSHGVEDGLKEIEDEERARLHAHIRALEEECTDLRRGIWRDHRTAMQPAMGDDGGASKPNAGFDDVDLSGGASRSNRQRGSSSLQDIINSGLGAFAGHAPRRSSSNAASTFPPRKQSLGLPGNQGGGDFDFDEDAFRLAHEEEARRRVDRVKEIKRGLEKFRGWRVDIVDVRLGMGGVVDV